VLAGGEERIAFGHLPELGFAADGGGGVVGGFAALGGRGLQRRSMGQQAGHSAKAPIIR
jgi:hypothetical protein